MIGLAMRKRTTTTTTKYINKKRTTNDPLGILLFDQIQGDVEEEDGKKIN